MFLEEETPQSNKVVTVEEELDGIDIDGIRNLMDLPWLMFIDQECGNLKKSLMVKSLLEVMTERGSQQFYKPICVHSLTNATTDLPECPKILKCPKI